MNDCVWTYHANGHTCGVAKFNHQLAHRLGVPCQPLGSACSYPLVSVKPSELPEWFGHRVVPADGPYDLFLHDWRSDAKPLLKRALRVFAANAVVAREIRPYRPDVETVFCPSTHTGQTTRGQLHVLTFGMAHKVQLPHYEALKAVLDVCGQTYTVGVSTAIHEGSPWEEAAKTADRLEGIFGSHLRRLGYLGDDGLATALKEAQLVALFFSPAARANNTSLWACLEAGRRVVTNLDHDSPPELVHGTTVLNIDLLMPVDLHFTTSRSLYPFGAAQHYTWPKLLDKLKVPVPA